MNWTRCRNISLVFSTIISLLAISTHWTHMRIPYLGPLIILCLMANIVFSFKVPGSAR